MIILKKLIFICKTLMHLSWWIQFKFILSKNGKVLFYKKIATQIDFAASIAVRNGVLVLGKAWIANYHGNNLLVMKSDSKLIVNGDFIIYSDFSLILNEGAEVVFNEGYINSGLSLECHKKIVIGTGVAIGSNVIIRDGDSKKLFVNGIEVNQPSPIIIGDNVWIGEGAKILKGVSIGSGAVVAAGAVVCNDVIPNSVVAGVPAVMIRKNVRWYP